MTYVYKTKPYGHQRDEVDRHASDYSRALFWEPGLGKTKGLIDTYGALADGGEVQGMFALSPVGLHRNLVTKQLPAHLAGNVPAIFYDAAKAGQTGYKDTLARFLRVPGLAVLSMAYDSMITPKGAAYARAFMESRRCLYGADEAGRFKNPDAKVTQYVLASARYAPYRRILTGTPIDNAPWDVWTQMKFLDASRVDEPSRFWRPHGLDSINAMKTRFQKRILGDIPVPGVNLREDGSRVTKKVWMPVRDPTTGRPVWLNLPQLWHILSSKCSRIKKNEVLDLPPKTYSRFEFDLHPEQRNAYDRLAKEAFLILQDGSVATAQLAITLMLRLQQITSGYLPVIKPPEMDDDGEFDAEPEIVMHRFEKNPRIDALRQITEDRAEKTIIWARFREDIDQIMALAKDMGRYAVRYDGAVSEAERAHNEDEFQQGDAEWFVSNQQVGGEGLTLTKSRLSIYYTNSFKLRHRLQSEDRNHRIGQTGSVEYIDIVAAHTVDEAFVSALLDKFNMAAQCTGDVACAWIRG